MHKIKTHVIFLFALETPGRMDFGEGFQALPRERVKSAKKPTELPFYQTPEHVVTSSKIITEAKSSLKRSQLRSIPTRRPETPQESQRKLFPCHTRDVQERPPSAFRYVLVFLFLQQLSHFAIILI